MRSNEQRFPSPLRYPGGKGKISNFLKLLFTENRLAGHGYAEPYAGGASVALQLLYDEYASQVHINDINRAVHAFWWTVLEHTEALCARVSGAQLSMTEWRRQQAVQTSEDPDPVDLGFSMFYLNRTSRSGIIGGGVIGGNKQTGEWKLDARFNKPELVRRIEKIARYRSRITLTRQDAATYLTTTYPNLGAPTVAYLDPPYYVKGAGLYENFYSHDDHARVAAIVDDLPGPWVVSYDAAPAIMQLYRKHRGIKYGLHYSASDSREGSEVMYFSHDLRIPIVRSPSDVTPQQLATARLRAIGGTLATVELPQARTAGGL